MKINLVIRFINSLSASEQVPDLPIPIGINFEKDNVNRLVNVIWLKTTIRSKVPQCANKRLRLIYNGRVLNEKTDFKNEVLKTRNEADQIYIHCVIGEELTPEQLAQENQLDNRPQQKSTNPEVIGFDRLLQQGFSQDDIVDLRRQFYSIYGGGGGPGGDIADVEEDENRQNRLRQLEERWIESTSNTGATERAAPATQDGDQLQAEAPSPSLEADESRVNEDLLLGFCIGIFLGVVAGVFLLVDETVFNKRQKMSILAGIAINFSLAIIRGQWV
ncbi:DSC3 DSC E3 ubiquitin ligase complex subunit 3 [Candida maltosa Xu316]